MRALRTISLIVLSAIVAACGSSSSSSSSPSSNPTATPTTLSVPAATLTPAACPDPGSSLRCGTVSVPVEWSHPEKGNLKLFVSIQKAETAATNPPVLMLGGGYNSMQFGWGSGQPASAPSFGGDHDVVYVDRRGVGQSEGKVSCPEVQPYAVDLFTTRAVTPAEASALALCRQHADAGPVPVADLLDLDAVAHDLVAVRQAIGVPTWTIDTNGLGLDVAERVAGFDPKGVAAIVANEPRRTDQPFDGSTFHSGFAALAADCAADAACAAPGDLTQALAKLHDRLAASPVTTSVVDKRTGQAVVLDVPIVEAGIADALVDSSLQGMLPSLIRGEADGSADALVANYLTSLSADDWTTASWMIELYQCGGKPVTSSAGDAPFDQVGNVEDSHRCEAFGTVPTATTPMVQSDVPVLAFVGSYDPETSPDRATSVLAGFRNAKIVVLPHVGDAVDQGGQCVRDMRDRFIANPTATVDTSCTSTLTPPTFTAP